MTLTNRKRIAPLAGIAIAGAVACGGSRQQQAAYESGQRPRLSFEEKNPQLRLPKKSCQKRCDNRYGIQACLIEEYMEDCQGYLRNFGSWRGLNSCPSTIELLGRTGCNHSPCDPTHFERDCNQRVAWLDDFKMDFVFGRDGRYKTFFVQFFVTDVREKEADFKAYEYRPDKPTYICGFEPFTVHNDGRITPDRSLLYYLGITDFKVKILQKEPGYVGDDKYGVAAEWHYMWGTSYIEHPD